MERLDALCDLDDGPGATRIGGSNEEDEAHRLAVGWLEEAGLAVEVDPAGNLIGRLAGRRPELPEVWSGSHLDTVPQGGRFDGALGVVAALEAVVRLGPQERTLGVVAFRDEERGCAGSRAFVARGGPFPGAFVEVHVEQGRRLAEAGAPLAAVTGIAGQVRRTVVFEGAAGHAGTTPMGSREDALVKAAEFVLRARDTAASIEGAVATVGRIEVEPGAVNVIPGRATVTVDARAPEVDGLERLSAELGLDVTPAHHPVPMAEVVRGVLLDELAARGLPALELTSWAGHDAGILAAGGIPSGMLFVRSLNDGISHSPDELSSPEDVALAVDVLAGALARLAGP
jgi:acetylornithine deacetylase/succinyl-diaminopimelate desuccinylase-like protein